MRGRIRSTMVMVTALVAGAAIPALLARAVRAQPNPQSPPVPANPAQQQQARRFVATFRNDVVSGCLTQPPQLRNPRGYCTCYADAFVNRFTADDLLSIERAAQVQGVANVIALMMAPEIRACRLAN